MDELIIVDKTDLDDIANAVREQTGETELMSIKAISPKIRSLSIGGPAVQSDWNQNDPEADDYIKNRTHWIEGANVVALPATDLTVNKGSVDLYEVPVEGLTPDALCVVTIDGESYETTAVQGVFNAYEWYIIGNSELIGEGDANPHLPFGIFVDKYNENYMELADRTKSGTVNVKIEVVSQVIHKIPAEYLPTTIGAEGAGTFAEVFNDLNNNTASGDYSHAENLKTTASGYGSHAQGLNTFATGYGSHAEGVGSIAKGPYTHAEGYYTEANGSQSHTEGSGTIADGANQHVSGSYNIADSASLVIVGNGTNSSSRANAYRLDKTGNGYFSGNVYANGNKKLVAENEVLILTQPQTFTDDELNQIRANLKFIGRDMSGKTVTINGETVTASNNAEIFGDYTTNIATGQFSIAEGTGTIAKGSYSHAESFQCQALGHSSHAEGYKTKATGNSSHAEGEMTLVSSYASHAEGSYTSMPDGTTRYSTAAGYASHTEGGGCHTYGAASHAEGIANTANGVGSHVEGRFNIASGSYQHVEGLANIEDTANKYIHIAGNGSSMTARSNAYTLDWSGNGWFAGSVEAPALILKSPNGTRFQITVDDNGELTTTALE